MHRFERALSRIADGNYRGALRDYEKMNSEQPDDEGALCGIALVHLLEDRLVEAAECMDDILEVRPDAAYPYGIAGAIAGEICSADDAVRLYDAMISADPSDAAAYVRKAQILLGRGRKKESADIIRECAKAASPYAETPMAEERLKSILESANKKQKPAIRISDSASFVPGLNTLLDKVIGDELHGSDRSDPDAERLGGTDEKTVAIGEMCKALAAHPDTGTLRKMGEFLHDIGRASEALAFYERAIEADPGDMSCYGYMLAALQDAGDRAGITECLKKALKATPNDERGAALQERMRRWHRTMSRKQSNFIAEGISSAVKWHVARRKYDPSHIEYFTPRTAEKAGQDAMRALAKIKDVEVGSARASSAKLRKQAGAPPARPPGSRSMRREPAGGETGQDADAALARAVEMLADNKPRKAMNEYRKAEKYSPRDERVLCGMALMYLWSGHDNKALEYVEKLRAVRPDAACLHGIAGMSLEAYRRPEAALECYDQMLAADPGEVSAYVRKAMILHYDGMEKECSETIRECLNASWSGRESPKEKRRLREMGRSLEKKGRVAFKVHDGETFFPGLWEMLDMAFGPDQETGAPDAKLDFEGIRLAGKGDMRGCLERAERAIKDRPHSTTPWCMKATLLVEDGRIDEAMACYERAGEIDSDAMEVYFGKAALLVDEGNTKGALKYIGKALYYELEDDKGYEMQKDLAYVHGELENGFDWPQLRGLRAVSDVIRWAAGRRAKSAGKKLDPAGRRAGGAEPIFPPDLIDGEQLEAGKQRAGRRR